MKVNHDLNTPYKFIISRYIHSKNNKSVPALKRKSKEPQSYKNI